MKVFKPNKYCEECKGGCCKSMPGACLPEDVARLFPAESLIESVKLALASKKFSVDWYEASDPIYYLRPAIVGYYKRFDPSWGGQCVLLTDTGCSLSFEFRPNDCKCVDPRKNHRCPSSITDNTKLFHGEAWKKTDVDFEQLKEAGE